MVWGFITSSGFFKIFQINGKIDSNKYINLLKNSFLDEAISIGLSLKDIVFQQDNASCHVSKKTLS